MKDNSIVFKGFIEVHDIKKGPPRSGLDGDGDDLQLTIGPASSPRELVRLLCARFADDAATLDHVEHYDIVLHAGVSSVYGRLYDLAGDPVDPKTRRSVTEELQQVYRQLRGQAKPRKLTLQKFSKLIGLD